MAHSIDKLENDIKMTLAFLYTDLTMKEWAFYISQYHALCIRLSILEGEKPTVTHSKSDYII